MVHEGNRVVGVWKEGDGGGGFPPAGRYTECVHTQEVFAARSSGVERRGSRSSRSRREIEVGSQYGPKRTRRCSWEVSDHDWTGCINHGADDVCTGRRLGLDLLHGDRAPRDEALRRGQRDQGSSNSPDRLNHHVPSKIRE